MIHFYFLGLAGVIAGHPFDTVKVRLQNESSMKGGTAVYRSTLQTFKLIIKEESVQIPDII